MVPSQLGPAEMQRVVFREEIYFGNYVCLDIFLAFLLLLLQLDDELWFSAIKEMASD